MPRETSNINRSPPQSPEPANPNHDYVNEWSLPGGEPRPKTHDTNAESPVHTANNQLGAE